MICSRSERERRSIDGKPSQADIKHASLIVNTADYCQNTAQEVGICRTFSSFQGLTVLDEQLEEKVKEKISDEYKEKISLQTERDLFVGYVHFGAHLP